MEDSDLDTTMVIDERETFCIHRVIPEKRKKGPPIVLEGNEVVIGRHPMAHILIRSENISRKHAVLTKTGNSWNIQDELSTNGVWVNERKLTPGVPTKLRPGDLLSLGLPEEADYKYVFTKFGDSPTCSPPRKTLKEDLEQLKKTQELDKKLRDLEQQLLKKEEAEKKLQDQLQAQQKEYQETLEQEKLRILAEKEVSEAKIKEEAEARMRTEFQERLTAEKQALQETLQAQREALAFEIQSVEQELKQKLTREMQESLLKERQRLNQELEQSAKKAEQLEHQLVETQINQNKSKSNLVHQFGDLLETEFNCSICSELFAEAYTLGCSHTFCKHCITTWKKKKNECPICRTKIKSMAHALVVDNFIEQMVHNLSPDMRQRRIRFLKERGLPTSNLATELQNQTPIRTNVTNTSASTSVTVPATAPLQINYVPTTTTPVLATGSQPTILLRPVNNSSLPPAVQAALGAGTNTFRLVTVAGQQTLQVIPNVHPAVTVSPPAALGSVLRPRAPVHGQQRLQFQPRTVFSTLPATRVQTASQPRLPIAPSLRGLVQQTSGGQGRGRVRTRGGHQPTQQTGARPRTQAPPRDSSENQEAAVNESSLVVHEEQNSGEVFVASTGIADITQEVQSVQDNGEVIIVRTDQLDNSVHSTVEVSSISENSENHYSTADSNNNVSQSTTVNSGVSNDYPAVAVDNSSSGTDAGNAIVITDSEGEQEDEDVEEEDDSMNLMSEEYNSDDSDNSDYHQASYIHGAYYGGYGRCYSCGDRGHWANGCPYR